MRKLLVLLIPVLLTVAAVGCSGTEEVVGTTAPASGTHTATASATPTGTATAPVSGTATPTTTATPSGGDGDGGVPTAPATLPATTVTPPSDWSSFQNSQFVAFTFRYPNAWYRQGNSTYTSWDPAQWTAPHDPVGGERVTLNVVPIASDANQTPPPEAVSISIAGADGWHYAQEFPGGAGAPPYRRHVVAIDRGIYRVYIIGRFTGSNPDESTFLLILQAFRFDG